MENLHLKIKAIRKGQGKTLEQVASSIGMTKGNLSRMEKGDVAISPEKLLKLATCFGMSVEELAAYETLEERVTKEERQDTLSEKLRQREDQIRRMQQANENYLYGIYGKFLFDAEQDRKNGVQDVKSATDRLMEMRGIEHLLNGENTSVDFPLLAPFREHRQKQASAYMDMIREELGLSPEDPDPKLPK